MGSSSSESARMVISMTSGELNMVTSMGLGKESGVDRRERLEGDRWVGVSSPDLVFVQERILFGRLSELIRVSG